MGQVESRTPGTVAAPGSDIARRARSTTTGPDSHGPLGWTRSAVETTRPRAPVLEITTSARPERGLPILPGDHLAAQSLGKRVRPGGASVGDEQLAHPAAFAAVAARAPSRLRRAWDARGGQIDFGGGLGERGVDEGATDGVDPRLAVDPLPDAQGPLRDGVELRTDVMAGLTAAARSAVGRAPGPRRWPSSPDRRTPRTRGRRRHPRNGHRGRGGAGRGRRRCARRRRRSGSAGPRKVTASAYTSVRLQVESTRASRTCSPRRARPPVRRRPRCQGDPPRARRAGHGGARDRGRAGS